MRKAGRTAKVAAGALALLLCGYGCSDSEPGGAGVPVGAPDAGGAEVSFGPGDTAGQPDSSAGPDAVADVGPDPGAEPDAGGPDPGPQPDAGPDAVVTNDEGPPPDAPLQTPQIAVDPEAYTFSYISPLPSSLTKQVTIANYGYAPLQLTSIGLAPGSSTDFDIILIPPLPKTLAPGKTTLVTVRFQEIQSSGEAILQIASNDPVNPLIEIVFDSYLKATVAQPPDPCVALNPAKLNFGTVVRGTSKTLQTTLSNCSDLEPLALTDITRSSIFFLELTQEFQIDNEPAYPHSIPPGGSLVLDVTYSPKLAGPDSGSFILHTDDPTQPQTYLDVSGIGVQPPEEDLGLTIKLSWDSDLCDVDSHLLMPGGSFFDCDSDCHFGNPAPDWGVQGDWIDDPFLDVDDVDGFGPEHTNISEPQPGVYTFIVHYYDDTFEGSFPTATNATVEVLSYGMVVATFGPEHLDQTNRNWDVFTVEWPSLTITPLGSTYMTPASSVNACFNFGFP